MSSSSSSSTRRCSRRRYGELPDLAAVDPASDVVFTWNGTTSGVRVPNGDWISDDREGLTIADATSAAFAQDLPWDKIDVATFSWQKVLGGEGGHGMLILGPRAVERLESYTPPWPLPKIFRLTKGGKLIEGIFKGETINTPSMLAVEDYIFALEWARGPGGLPALIARADANAAARRRLGRADRLDRASRRRSGDPLATPASASNSPTSAAGIDDEAQRALVKKIAALLEAEGAAYDIAGYRDAPPGLRIWCGATVETDDHRSALSLARLGLSRGAS